MPDHEYSSMPVELLIQIALDIFASNIKLTEEELYKINKITRELKYRVQMMKSGVPESVAARSEALRRSILAKR